MVKRLGLVVCGVVIFVIAEARREPEELPGAVIEERYIGKIEESRPVIGYEFDPYVGIERLLGREYVLDRRLDESIERINAKLLSLQSVHLRTPVVVELVDLTRERLQIRVPSIPGRPARWELKITDSRGQLFRRIEGRGLPPEKIEWDGRGDQGQLLTVGAIYSYVLEVESEVGARERRILEPLRIPGVLAELPSGGYIISIDSRVLFHGVALKPEATPYLEAAANLIKERSATSVTIAAHSERQAQRVADILKSRISFLTVQFKPLEPRFVNLDITF